MLRNSLSWKRIAEVLVRARNSSSVNSRIFRAALLVSVASAVVKLMATAKEFVVASYFGRGDALDAFLIAFLVPGFIVSIVSISFNTALIPTLVQVREQKGGEAAQKLFSNMTVLGLGLLLILSGVIAITGPRLLGLVGSGFGPAKLALTCRLFYLLLPWIVINGLVTTCAAVLNAGERFIFSSLTPLLTPVFGMLFLTVLGRKWGIWAYAGGTLVGALAEAVLLVSRLQHHGFTLWPHWYGMNEETRQVCAQWTPVMAGSLLVCGVGFVDQSMAAMLAAGSVAALNYATRIVSAVAGLFSSSLSTAVTPYFSKMIANGQFAECGHTLRIYRRLTIAVTVPITLALVLLSRPLVTLLYQRGAFTAVDTAIVFRVQSMLAFQIPFYAVSMLHVRLISSLKRNGLLLCGAAINLTLDVILNLICMKYWGVAGIALATSLYYVVSSIFIVVAAHWALERATCAGLLAPPMTATATVATAGIAIE